MWSKLHNLLRRGTSVLIEIKNSDRVGSGHDRSAFFSRGESKSGGFVPRWGEIHGETYPMSFFAVFAFLRTNYCSLMISLFFFFCCSCDTSKQQHVCNHVRATSCWESLSSWVSWLFDILICQRVSLKLINLLRIMLARRHGLLLASRIIFLKLSTFPFPSLNNCHEKSSWEQNSPFFFRIVKFISITSFRSCY